MSSVPVIDSYLHGAAWEDTFIWVHNKSGRIDGLVCCDDDGYFMRNMRSVLITNNGLCYYALRNTSIQKYERAGRTDGPPFAKPDGFLM